MTVAGVPVSILHHRSQGRDFKEKVVTSVGWKGSREVGWENGGEWPEHVCLLVGDTEGVLEGQIP